MLSELSPVGMTFTSLVLEIFRLNGLLLESGDELLSPLGLSSARWQVLGALEAAGSQPVATIARTMGLSRQAVQQTADALEQGGFVVYAENPHHQRAKLIVLTPKGKDALGQIMIHRAAWANRAGDMYGGARLEDALALLRQMGEALGREGIPASPAPKDKEVSS